MRLATALLIAVTMVAANPSRSAEREWATETRAQGSFATAIYNSSPSRLIVECRESPYLAPELSMTLLPSLDSGSPDGAIVEAIFATKEDSTTLPMTRVGQGTDTAYRWTGLGGAAVGPMRKIAEAVSMAQELAVTFKGRSPVLFPYGLSGSSRMQDVVLRCLPSVVRARRQATSSTNVSKLLTLSDDANDRCRGGGVEDVWGACAERTEYGERLGVLGMCYGKQGQSG